MDHFDALIQAWLKEADDPFDYVGAIGKRSSASVA